MGSQGNRLIDLDIDLEFAIEDEELFVLLVVDPLGVTQADLDAVGAD